jgi:hypothetical protein
MAATTKESLALEASKLTDNAYRLGFRSGIARVHGKRVSDLLEKFVDLYGEVPLEGSMIGPGLTLWREYYEFIGEHMILTDEGWESGEMKQSYLDEYGPKSILNEVNAPA